MTLPNVIARSDSEMLQSSIDGDVFVPGDGGYDEARRAWNLAADQRPDVVVVVESIADVVRAVGFARLQGIRIAPQGIGHGALPLEPLDGAMLLKTSRLRDVKIYPDTRQTVAGTPFSRRSMRFREQLRVRPSCLQ